MENCFWPDEDYGSWDCTQTGDTSFMVPWLSPDAAAALQFHCHNPAAALVPPWAPPFEGLEEDRVASASRSHSEAEKRRRDRINSHLSTLRKLIPKSEKMDKAALLGQVVDHVKEQSKRAKEVSKHTAIPTETDEVVIQELNNADDQETRVSQDVNGRSMCVKASVCCEDRPELIGELNIAIKGLGLTIFRAEITSLGGRMKTEFILLAKDQNVVNTSALKLALSRVVLSSGSSSYSMRSKRQRFFYPNSH